MVGDLTHNACPYLRPKLVNVSADLPPPGPWFGAYFLLERCSAGPLIGVLQIMSKHNVKMEATEQEQQMVEVVRAHKAGADFRLLVERQDGAWDVTLSIEPHDELNTSRGTGLTFNDAWGNMAPLWA